MAQNTETKENQSLVFTTSWLVTGLIAVGVLFSWIARGLDDSPLAAIAAVTLSFANCIYLYFNRSSISGAWALILILALSLAVVGYTSGGFDGPVLILAPLVPIISVLLVNALAGWISVVAVAFILSTLFAMQLLGAMPTNPNSETGVLVGRYLAALLSSLVATWVVFAFSEYIRQLNSENRTLALTDFLTGLPNRRSVNEKLSNETARVRRSGAWLSVLMLDIDRFKRYNDVNGHTAGDQCLVRVANILKATARRPTDLAGRYGGEEFIVILPETDATGAALIAESIRSAIEAEMMPYEPDQQDYVTISIGVHSSPGKLISVGEDLIKYADEALYRAKEGGRNRVITDVAVEAKADADGDSEILDASASKGSSASGKA